MGADRRRTWPGDWPGCTPCSPDAAHPGPGGRRRSPRAASRRRSVYKASLGDRTYRVRRLSACTKLRSLTALLHVITNELLCIIFEHGVDFIEQVVDVFLELLAAL